ncbi:hypothetical protein ACKC9G_09455 [Pokkaliibacter sp. CJK22405]|uniref:hypothetical protein n=1 Tax=Pokkaliibacter sp. CJK22405 TaxID=3384615 RepID=UPI003984B62F
MPSLISGLDLARLRHLDHAHEAQPADQADGARRSHPAPAGTLEALEQRLETLRQSTSDAGLLQHALNGYVQHHQRFNRQLVQDWTSAPYIQRRRKEYAGIPGGQTISSQFGLSQSMNFQSRQTSEWRQLRMDHPANTLYNRASVRGGLRDQCLERYKERGGNPADPVVFVNSAYMADRIVQSARAATRLPLTDARAQQLNPGLIALHLPDPRAIQAAEKFIPLFGATPSAYAVMQPTQPTSARQMHGRADAVEMLSQLKGITKDNVFELPEDNVCQRLRNLPMDHSHAALSNTAAELIEQLISDFEDSAKAEEHKHDPLLHMGLQGLRLAAEAMSTEHNDSHSFANAYQLLTEELQVCLSATRPYSIEDFHDRANDAIRHAPLPASIREPQSFLTSSGMAAITQSVRSAGEAIGSPGVNYLRTAAGEQTPIYYELAPLRHNPNGRVLFATLNQSLPGREGVHKPGWNVRDVVDAVQHQLVSTGASPAQPQVLILDSTIEHQDDLPQLFKALAPALENGSLRLILNKSYQKYANLCSAKVMAGGITLISPEDEVGQKMAASLNQHEQALDWMSGPDAQLMTHFLGCHEQEYALLEQAVDNANFVREECFHGKDGHASFLAHDDHLPFATFYSESMGTESKHFIDVEIGYGEGYGTADDTTKEGRTVLDQLPDARTSLRGSFGFANTTYGNLTGADESRQEIRLSFGQETKPELMEAFFMPSRLMHEGGSQWSVNEAEKLIHSLVNEALKEHPMPGQPRASLADKLRHIARTEQPSLNTRASAQAPLEQLSQTHTTDGSRQKYTINKVASVLCHLSEFITANADLIDRPAVGRDREALEGLLRGMIDSGMPGVTGPGRQSILNLHSELQISDLHHGSGEQTGEIFRNWMDELERFPNTPVKYQALTRLPLFLMDELEPRDQERFRHFVLNNLDHDTRLQMIEGLIGNEYYSLASTLLKGEEEYIATANRDKSSLASMQQHQLERQSLRAVMLRQQINDNQMNDE